MEEEVVSAATDPTAAESTGVELTVAESTVAESTVAESTVVRFGPGSGAEVVATAAPAGMVKATARERSATVRRAFFCMEVLRSGAQLGSGVVGRAASDLFQRGRPRASVARTGPAHRAAGIRNRSLVLRPYTRLRRTGETPRLGMIVSYKSRTPNSVGHDI
ncbi:hypothetical protein V7793_01680 [Streptomyces sp. KLMMK]|uniref:hypothetical protein n=1 Tax=Streptomyces sp. KLMMK TaxID=3109353 RepID=UPI002FFF20A5